MRIAHVTTSPVVGSIAEIVERFPVLARFPEAQARLGHTVALFCRSDRDSRVDQHGVQLQGMKGRSRLEALERLTQELGDLAPQVVHLNGIIPNNGLLAVRVRVRLPTAVIAIHDQVIQWGRVSSLARVAMRAGLQRCDLAFFSARTLANPLVESGALSPNQVSLLPGGSCTFSGVTRAEARSRTGLSGDPLYLWVGRLAEVKNPLFAARALARVLTERPSARLALAYGDDEMLEPMKQLLDRSPQVTWLGKVPTSEMEDLYSSADVFISTSWREGYSFALAEAMACGVSPVVSAIPASLQAIGTVGRSFAAGDEEGLVAALMAEPSPRGEVRAHFERELSYPAMAERSLAAYRSIS